MKDAFRGRPIGGELPADELRAWRLLKLGVSLTEQESAPVVLQEWLLEIDSAFNMVASETKGGSDGSVADRSGLP